MLRKNKFPFTKVNQAVSSIGHTFLKVIIFIIRRKRNKKTDDDNISNTSASFGLDEAKLEMGVCML